MSPNNANGRLSPAQVAEEAERLRLIRAARAGDIEAQKKLLMRWNLRVLSGDEFARLAAGRSKPPLPAASPDTPAPVPPAPAGPPTRRIAPAPRAAAVNNTGGGGAPSAAIAARGRSGYPETARAEIPGAPGPAVALAGRAHPGRGPAADRRRD